MKNLATLAFLLLFTTAAFAQLRPVKKNLQLDNNTTENISVNSTSTTITASEKQAALTFGNQVIEAYFNQNCTFITDNFATQLLSMESGTSVAVDDQLKQGFCAESPIRQDIQATFSMYQANYTAEILNHTEFANQYPNKVSVYNMQEGDYFFNGANLNQGATNLFRYEDMAVFILRKTNNGFKIIAM